MDFASGGKRACGYRQTAENEAVGVERPFRVHEKDILQPREGRLSGAGRGAAIDRVGEDPCPTRLRGVTNRRDSRAHEKRFSCR